MNVFVARRTELIKTSRKKITNAFEVFSAITIISLCVIGTLPQLCSALKIADILPRKNERSIFFRRRRPELPAQPAKVTKASALSSSLSGCYGFQQNDPNGLFPNDLPLLGIITETDACDSEEKMKHTYTVIEQAASTGKVDLVSVRLSLPPHYNENSENNSSYHQVMERACRLTKKLMNLSVKQNEQTLSLEDENASDDNNTIHQQLLSSRSFIVVCSSDLVSVAVEARAHGVHVKERHLDQLEDIVRRFDYPIVIGTSTHSVESALKSYFYTDSSETDESNESKLRQVITRPRPDYYFVGTCYLTASHPEKTLQSQLEGPGLPGRVKRAICENLKSQQVYPSTEKSREDSVPITSRRVRLPRIIAIGGIGENNCHEPVALGADGVAVIRAVLQAENPIERVERMQNNMMSNHTQDS